jgi:hypothetical protein
MPEDRIYTSRERGKGITRGEAVFLIAGLGISIGVGIRWGIQDAWQNRQNHLDMAQALRYAADYTGTLRAHGVVRGALILKGAIVSYDPKNPVAQLKYANSILLPPVSPFSPPTEAQAAAGALLGMWVATQEGSGQPRIVARRFGEDQRDYYLPYTEAEAGSVCLFPPAAVSVDEHTLWRGVPQKPYILLDATIHNRPLLNSDGSAVHPGEIVGTAI